MRQTLDYTKIRNNQPKKKTFKKTKKNGKVSFFLYERPMSSTYPPTTLVKLYQLFIITFVPTIYTMRIIFCNFLRNIFQTESALRLHHSKEQKSTVIVIRSAQADEIGETKNSREKSARRWTNDVKTFRKKKKKCTEEKRRTMRLTRNSYAIREQTFNDNG